MKLRPSQAALASFALFATLIASAQQSSPVAQFTDPANLRGERVRPRDGRELPIDQGARGLEQMLRKLNTRASLMLIVAHPDDEDGGMLTYYSRGLGARVAVLTLTRGEGGQNAMTGDFEDALGLLRTQELLSADRYLGVDQFFGTEVDFGFSKTKEEAFKKWTHERVLYDAVRSIRLYRPLVIAAVFIGGVTDGHGQHQVSGQIAQEAFKAAADPAVFPDMIAEGILPWQALKVYARVPMQSISDKGLFDYATGKYTAPRFENYVTGEVTTTTPSADVIVHEGTVDKLLSDNPNDPPRTYVQFARIGLGLQKSQVGSGMRVPSSGAYDVSYHRYGSNLPNQPVHEIGFFDGIDTSIEGIAGLAPNANDGLRMNLSDLQASIREATQHFSPNDPSALAASLATAIKRCDVVIEAVKSQFINPAEKTLILRELEIKYVQLNDALSLSLGLTITAKASEDTFLTESSVDASVTIAQNSQLPITYRVVRSGNSIGDGIQEGSGLPSSEPHLAPGHPLQTECGLSPNLTATATRPYFFRSGIEDSVYQLADPNLRNAPVTPPALRCFAELSFNDVPLTIGAVAEHEGKPINFVPLLSTSLSNHAQVVSRWSKSFTISLTATPVDRIIAVSASFGRQNGGDGQSIAKPDHGYLPPVSTFELPLSSTAPFTVDGSALSTETHSYNEGYRPIGYGDLPRTNYYTPATVRIVPVDLNLPTNKKIAYLPGTGDAVPEALASINLKPEILTVADLTPAKLSQYDTVILGVRIYAAHPDLHGAPTQALLDYARNGGNVLVQYQTAEFTAADAPYPLTLGYSAEKVVDETDSVQLLDPSAPFLTTPNKITPADFNNWVEERGHGFLKSWDTHYTTLTETHDPDQDPQRGGLITTNLGKGRWTYCAFALYRQLPEAVPGAFRLFVNLINSPTR